MSKAKNRSETGTARAQRGERTQGASAAAPIHTERGKLGPGNQVVSRREETGEKAVRDGRGRFDKGNKLAPGPGRPPGSKDTRPRIGSIKAAFEDFIAKWNGEVKIVEAIDRGVTASDPRKAIGYLELAAKVLDKTDDTGGKHVHFHLHTNVDLWEPAWPVGGPALAQGNGQKE
jgi:hypothetical protein